MSALREAALRALEGRAVADPPGQVSRVTLDVDVDGRVEMITLSMRDGELLCASSDGQPDGAHVHAALRFVAGIQDAASPRVSIATTEDAAPVPPPAQQQTADSIDALVTAVVRVGAERALKEPSVDEALARLLQTAGEPPPPGLERFVGRFRSSLRRANTSELARILSGVSATADLLRAERSQAGARRLAAWFGKGHGGSPEVDLLYDRTLVELAREWLPGTQRNAIERRYLADVSSGTVYREDRMRGGRASLGPCPRQIHVGLGEVESGPAPQRIRILQYHVQPVVPASTWARLEQVASRGVEQLVSDYHGAVRAFPALAEPFIMMAPHQYRASDHGVQAFDRDGRPLRIAQVDQRGLVNVFDDITRAHTPRWIVGRLADPDGVTTLLPYGVCVSKDGRAVYHRLR